MARFKPGESGNPNGRPSGTGMQSKLKEAVGDRFDQIVDRVVEAALLGDMTAASLILSRLVPPIKATQEPQAFPMYGKSLTEKAESVLESVSAGLLSATDGKQILDAMAGVVRVHDGEILAKQLDQLKAILKAEKERVR